MKSFLRYLRLLAAAVLLLAAGCNKIPQGDDPETGLDKETRYYVNLFAYNTMNSLYLWADEIADGLKAWKTDADPVAKVQELRYKDASGKDVDRWTKLYDDFSSFYGNVTGNRTTYGLSYKLYYADEKQTRVYAVVTYTYADSPARKAGLKRGDTITEVNGEQMTPDNYQKVASEQLSGGTSVTLTLRDGTKKSLKAVQMYEEPVLFTRVFDCGGKPVGYLHYTSFTLNSCEKLVEVCKSFKAEGIRELILDLRYNGGGYAFTEEAFASMLAPEADVTAGHILSTEVFNSKLTESLGKQETPFRTEFTIESGGKKYQFSTKDANLGITRLYAIVDSGSASASESLLCQLYPYQDIVLIGAQTTGKFCSGLMMEAEDWYDSYAEELGDKAKGKDYVKDWGIYVMYSRFADRDGVTRCMPDGLKPDHAAQDQPYDGTQLGDPKEPMLAVALDLAGYPAASPAARVRTLAPAWQELPQDKPGYRILTPTPLRLPAGPISQP